jgi:23S rRNA pseudouridine2605 synthase
MTKKRTNPSDEKPVDEKVRLNKFIATAGVCSRRDADQLITEGKIKVNGKVVKELGTKVSKTDKVEYQGKKLASEKSVYVLLNKPKDFITTVNDPKNRKTVMKLVEKACEERIYPVGRLDRQTTGLLLFTNDGELAKRLMHPSHRIKKIYQVELDKPITKDHFEEVLAGIPFEDGKAEVDQLAILEGDGRTLGIEIHIGRNRIVRRIFEHLGYQVVKLDRVMMGNLTKKDLPRGKYRHLKPREIQNLKNSVHI